MADLARLLREARIDNPDSLRALAHALAREGFDDGVLHQFELTWWAPSGVVLRPGVVFEGGRGVAFRVRVKETLGYHLHVAPDDSWSEAEIAITESGDTLLRLKAMPARRPIVNEAHLLRGVGALGERLDALRDEATSAEPSLATSEDVPGLLAAALAGAVAWTDRGS